MVDENLLKTVSRIYNSDDGQELIEFMRRLSSNNYKAWKQSPTEFGDLHKGQAIAIDELIDLFDTCDIKLLKMNEVTVEPIVNPYD